MLLLIRSICKKQRTEFIMNFCSAVQCSAKIFQRSSLSYFILDVSIISIVQIFFTVDKNAIFLASKLSWISHKEEPIASLLSLIEFLLQSISHQFIADDDGNVDDVGSCLGHIFVDVDIGSEVGKGVDRWDGHKQELEIRIKYLGWKVTGLKLGTSKEFYYQISIKNPVW